MNIFVFALDAFKALCALAVVVCFMYGTNVIGYVLTGQRYTVVPAENANRKKEERAGVIFIAVVLVGAILWALTGVPFLR